MRTWSTSIIASPSALRWASRIRARLARPRRLRQRPGIMRAVRGLSLCGVIAVLAITTVAPLPASAEIPDIVARKRAEKKVFTDAEITEGFLKTAFGAEFHLGGRVDRIRKYNGPVRVFTDGGTKQRKAQLAKVIADIGAHVAHLDIAMAERSEDANVVV